MGAAARARSSDMLSASHGTQDLSPVTSQHRGPSRVSTLEPVHTLPVLLQVSACLSLQRGSFHHGGEEEKPPGFWKVSLATPALVASSFHLFIHSFLHSYLITPIPTSRQAPYTRASCISQKKPPSFSFSLRLSCSGTSSLQTDAWPSFSCHSSCQLKCHLP